MKWPWNWRRRGSTESEAAVPPEQQRKLDEAKAQLQAFQLLVETLEAGHRLPTQDKHREA